MQNWIIIIIIIMDISCAPSLKEPGVLTIQMHTHMHALTHARTHAHTHTK